MGIKKSFCFWDATFFVAIGDLQKTNLGKLGDFSQYISNLVSTGCLSLHHFYNIFIYEFEFNHFLESKEGSHFNPVNSLWETHLYKSNIFDWILTLEDLFSTTKQKFSSSWILRFKNTKPVSIFWKNYQNIPVQTRKIQQLFENSKSGAKYRSERIIPALR